jgi:hypothetical protein
LDCQAEGLVALMMSSSSAEPSQWLSADYFSVSAIILMSQQDGHVQACRIVQAKYFVRGRDMYLHYKLTIEIIHAPQDGRKFGTYEMMAYSNY